MPPRGFPQINSAMPRSPFQFGNISRAPMQGGRMLFQPTMQSMGRVSPFGLRGPLAGGGTPPAQGAGGLLSRLFQRSGASQAGNIANAAAGFQRAGAGASGGGSILGNIANPGKIGSFLNNTQNVIRTAQQIGPMVQQYGPLVRNLPAMWRMYKGMKSSGDDEETSVDSTSNDDESVQLATKTGERKKKLKTSQKNKKETQQVNESDDEHESSEQINQKGASVPKLYI
ncbi:hypothetical protein J6TS2_18480 [Heyndrickxia sporothermodurans]|nr:hypothetical protein J6TS2_18480 [Heyndrickxia sporothermodurans]